MKIVPTSQNSEHLDSIAKDAIWGGIRKYLRLKTSPKDVYTDIYYIAYAHAMGLLALAMHETGDTHSPERVIKIINNAIINAIKDWHDIDVTKKPSKH